MATEAIGFGVFGAVLPLPLGVFLVLYYRPWRKVAVFDGGLVVADRRTRQVWRWGDITSVTSSLRRNPRSGLVAHRHEIRSRGGGTVTLKNGVAGVDGVADVIVQQVMPRIAQEAVRALNQGRSVPFGVITLEPGGVRMPSGRVVAWTSLDAVEISGGIFQLRSSDMPPMAVLCESVANLPALLTIVGGAIPGGGPR